MICPKCKKVLQEQGVQCPHCGIFFAKYAKYHSAQSEQPDALPSNIKVYDDYEEAADSHPLAVLLFENTQQDSSGHFIGRAIIFMGLVVWGWLFMSSTIDSNAAGESFLHMINTPFHEAGHVIFRPFGQFITSLGGTLGQLLMPLICMGTLLFKTRDPFGASVTLWWFGENFLDIAPYMDDARAGDLPLLGGNFGHSSPYGFHDWEYLLTESNLIEYDHVLARIVFVIGIIIMLLSLLWAGLLLFKQYKVISNL
ncbi:MAG: zinc ribbon domain-containing protein [Methylococcaceae bacterium]|nr:zinc ribbon domain-containing protein [Methylococcaceae bacterium]